MKSKSCGFRFVFSLPLARIAFIGFGVLFSANSSGFAQLTFDPANPPSSASPPTELYNEYTGAYSHQKGPKTVLVFLVRPSDGAAWSSPPTFATLDGQLTAASANFYNNYSHRQAWFGPKRRNGMDIPRLVVTPVLQLPGTASAYMNGFGQLQSDCLAAVRALGGVWAAGQVNDYENFDRWVVMSNTKLISSTGLAYVGGRFAWTGGSLSGGTAEHEWGHNWGVYHANAYTVPTGAEPRAPGGTSGEYADGWDLMGGNTVASGFNLLFREGFGFLERSRNEVLDVTASGTYRLYDYIHPDRRQAAALTRGLLIPMSSFSDRKRLFLGFGHVATGSDTRTVWNRNAVTMHTELGNSGSSRIDTTPGSIIGSDADDSSIKIGRTYSEGPNVNGTQVYGGFHITPTARGATTVNGQTHEWIDVVVNYQNAITSNAAPSASFSATSVPGSANSPLTLTINATDPNGDLLAYDWDFGNGAYSITNSASQSPTYTSPGLYLVRCTVSDMKGETTTAYQWANIGNQPTQPATTTTTAAGLHYRTYAGTWSALPNFDHLQPSSSGTCSGFDLAVKPSSDNFAILYTGYLDVPTTDIYQFEILCDDGAKLLIDGQTVITNDGLKDTALNKTGNIALAAGKHALRLEYFHKDGTETLQVKWWRIGQPKAAIPTTNLLQSDWAGNPAPSVAITSPTPADSFIVNSDIAIAATASATTSITKVVFFANGSLLAEDTTAPYTIVWPKVSVGSQTLTAIAYDSAGRWTQSAPVTFSVVSPAPTNGIGINFGANASDKQVFANEVAGAVYAYPNWNNPSTDTATSAALIDHVGNTSPAKLTFAANGTRSGILSSNADTSTANGKLLRGFLMRDHDIEPATEPNPYARITDIPYATYDVYVYFDGLETYGEDAAAQRYLLTPTEGGTPSARFGQNSLFKSDGKGDYPTYDTWTGFREATATALTDPADKLAGNYVVFRNQTSAGFKLEATRRDGTVFPAAGGRHKRYFSAIQIIQVTPTAPGLILRQTGGSTAVSEAGTLDTLTLALAFAPTADVTVTVSPDAQLTTDKTSLTFTPANWQTAQTISLGAVNDTANEGPHTGLLTLTATGGNYSGLAARTLSAAITDDDHPIINVTSNGNAREAAIPTPQTFRFARSGTASLAGAISVNFTLSGTADTAADFTLSGASVSYNSTTGNGSIIIPDGQSQVVLTLTPLNDSTTEAWETATLTLQAQPTYTLGTPTVASINIADDDAVDYLTEEFSNNIGTRLFDLNNLSITFTPSGGSYTAQTTPVAAFPSGTSGFTTYDEGAMNSGFPDDGYWNQALATPFTYFGVSYNTLKVATNGYVFFASTNYNGNDLNGSEEAHFVVGSPRIAGLGTDLNPATGGTVNYQRITTAGQQRHVFYYNAVRFIIGTNTASFQIELFDDGRIRITHIASTLINPSIVGLSSGVANTMPSSPFETTSSPRPFFNSDLSLYGGTAINLAPAFATIPPLSTTVGSTYSYSLAATDANGDSLTLTAPTKPAWLTFTDHGNGTATLTGTPPSPSTANLTLRASDGTTSTDQAFALTVAPSGGNTAPTFTSTPGSAPFLSVGNSYTYAITASDADGQSLTITATDLPAWLTLTTTGNGTATLTGKAPDTNVATHPVTLLVFDGITSTTQTFTLTLNRPPVITLTAPAFGIAQLASCANSFALSATTTDDGLPASLGAITTTWSQLSGPGTTTFADASATTTSASFSDPGTYRLRLTANDGAASSSKDIVIYVETTAALTTGLQGYWRFNEASGTNAADSSGNAKDLTLNGTVTFGTGVEGNAYSGSAADTQFAANTTLTQPTAMTFSAWVNSPITPGDGGNFRYLLAFRQTTNIRSSLSLPNAKKNLQFRSSHATQGVWDVTGYNVPANEWFHVAVTYDQSSTANNPTVYINGAAVTVTRATAPSGSVNTTDATRIGGSGGNAFQAWKGRIDEARLYNRILSADEAAFLPLTSTPNQAPAVSAALRDPIPAGSTSGTLMGTATDDGLPADPGTLTSTWSTLSGPGTVTYGNALALDSTVNFPAAGTYMLRLSATDGSATVFQDLAVTVTSSNTAPTISGLSAQTIAANAATGALAVTIGDTETAASALTLSATSSNTDLVPNANIVFGGSGANRTLTVTPAANQTGSSTITVTVSDGSLTASSTFTLTVTPNFSSWISGYPGVGGLTGPADDPDADGLTNLLEYALGSNPNSGAPAPTPQIANSKLQINFTRSTAATDLVLVVKASSDLVTWTDIARSQAGAAFAPLVGGVTVNESGSGSLRNVEVIDSESLQTAPRRFLRLKVELGQ